MWIVNAAPLAPAGAGPVTTSALGKKSASAKAKQCSELLFWKGITESIKTKDGQAVTELNTYPVVSFLSYPYGKVNFVLLQTLF